MTSDNGERYMLPKRGPGPNGGRPVTYPDKVVRRAIALQLQTHSYAHAWRQLKVELEAKGKPVPTYSATKSWGRECKDVIAHFDADRKDIGEVFLDVAEDYAEGMVEARPHLSYSQMPVAYGIAADKPIMWAKAGSPANVQAVQVNIVGSDGKRIDEV